DRRPPPRRILLLVASQAAEVRRQGEGDRVFGGEERGRVVRHELHLRRRVFLVFLLLAFLLLAVRVCAEPKEEKEQQGVAERAHEMSARWRQSNMGLCVGRREFVLYETTTPHVSIATPHP